jgi:hypothetical protein
METIQLKDSQILPTSEVLAEILGTTYPVYEELMETISSEAFGLQSNWNYYNDGKTWLCKVVFKKKTIFWLSVWDGYFKTGFYFTEKNCNGLFEMEIDETIKKAFVTNKPIGKLLPLTIDVKLSEQLPDLLMIVNYKKGLK